MGKIRVLLVDDQKLLLQSVKSVIDYTAPDLEVVGLAANGEEAVTIAEEHTPDVILMDVRMPVMDGVEATRRIRVRCPETKIIMLTTFDDDEYVLEAMRLGAVGYLLKDLETAELIKAVRSAHEGGVLIAPRVAAKMIGALTRGAGVRKPGNDGPEAKLTEREREILRQIALGRDNKEIADLLHLSPGTVKNHVSNIYAKLDLRDRAQAVRFAVDNFLV